MGRAKEWMMEQQEAQYEEARAEWIRRELNDEDADENTEGWQDLSDHYDKMISDYNDAIYDEYSWYHDQEYSNAYISFQQSVKDIESILKSSLSPLLINTHYKMAYGYLVTALEVYLGDALKSLVLKNDKYVFNAAKNLKEVKDRSLKPADVLLDKNLVEKIITEQLSEYLYHNIPKVLRIYRNCLGFDCKYDVSEVCAVTATRHDLVHRNGKKKDGTDVGLDLNKLRSAISAVEGFVNYLDKELLIYREEEV